MSVGKINLVIYNAHSDKNKNNRKTRFVSHCIKLLMLSSAFSSSRSNSVDKNSAYFLLYINLYYYYYCYCYIELFIEDWRNFRDYKKY